jgi:hypothetical protein
MDPAERGEALDRCARHVCRGPSLLLLPTVIDVPEKGSGKPTITPKTPFKVKDLHGDMRLHPAIDRFAETVDNRLFPTVGDVESRRSEKTFPQYER